ncbi:MAG TPA: M28 family peptidase [Rubrobacter sp.]|nr:M28 family peptidase [Rubrobacter sp.]
MKRTPTSFWMVRLGLVVALAIIALAAALPVIPPNPAPASAPESTFSAQRAMGDLRVVAREPHPIGSAEQERVRDYIISQARTLGFSTEVQRAAVGSGRTAENVIVRIPGTENSPRDVLITAHYDSAPSSPGAGDAGASVVAMLETMRVVEASKPLKNDLVFLFTDGEELGGPGAEVFVNRHPAAEDLGVAFVFDSEPDSGPTDMRTTSPGDAWLVRQLVEASPPVFANSATNTSDRTRLGNDFAAFPPAGIISAEFLLEGSVVRYHSPKDNVAAIDPRVVQDHGDTMLALARYFGNVDLDAARSSSEDLVFFTAPVLGLVAYPVWLASVLAVMAAILFIAVIVAARQRGRLSLARLTWGALAFLTMLLSGAALAWAVWELLLSMHPESASTLHFPDFEGSAMAVAVIFAVAVVAFVAVTHLLSRWIGAVELAAGALVWLAVLALALTLFESLFSAVALWPLLGGVVALSVVAFLGRGWAAGVLLALASVPGLVLVVPLLVLETLKVEDGAVVGVASLLLLLGSLLPQILLVTGRLVPEAEDLSEQGETYQRRITRRSVDAAERRPL